MLTVILTLTFDQLTSKSTGIIYTARCMSVPNLTNPGHSVQLLSRQGEVYQPTDRLADTHEQSNIPPLP